MKQITLKEGSITEAMSQIDVLEGLNVKEKGCLRLLTEEMYSMVHELLKVTKLDYEVLCEGRKYTMKVSTKAKMSEEARTNFLSMSTDGRNAAHKGLRGILRAMTEMLISDNPAMVPGVFDYDLGMTEIGNGYLWTMSQALSIPAKQETMEWDGMERSIIANFADDVSIGISGDKLTMTVLKSFA